MEITAKMVRELRERSGAPMMECKRALAATDGDLEGAFDHLRKAGLKSADKKSSRATGEGRVRVKVNADGTQGAMIALTCETDFVAKTDDFATLPRAALRPPRAARARHARVDDGADPRTGRLDGRGRDQGPDRQARREHADREDRALREPRRARGAATCTTRSGSVR